MKKMVLLVLAFCLILNEICFASNFEVQIDYNLSNKLEYEANAMYEVKLLSNEFKKNIETETFNEELYNKLDLFIKKYKTSLSSLTALQMIAGMCFWPATYDLYSQKGEQILDFITSNYSDYAHGKIAFIAKATALAQKGMKTEAIRLQEDKYEVILSIEKDKNFQYFIDEMNLKNTDDEYLMAGYYNLLGSIYLDIKDNQNASINLNKVIKQYPNIYYAKISQEMLKTIK